MAHITVSEGIGNLKALQARQAELIRLRDGNAATQRTYGEAPSVKTPLYNVIALDRTVTKLAMEIRKLDAALKKHNALSPLEGYEWEEGILGELETAKEAS